MGPMESNTNETLLYLGDLHETIRSEISWLLCWLCRCDTYVRSALVTSPLLSG